jgi:DNA-binding transcriptional MerR regulator
VRIGELSRRTGVSPRSLRYYEEQGLLESTRTTGGHREYADNAPDVVWRIQVLFTAGLRSDKVAELLPCAASCDGRVLAGPNLVADLRAQRERIDRLIADLKSSQLVIDEVVDYSTAVPVSAGGAGPEIDISG